MRRGPQPCIRRGAIGACVEQPSYRCLGRRRTHVRRDGLRGHAGLGGHRRNRRRIRLRHRRWHGRQSPQQPRQSLPVPADSGASGRGTPARSLEDRTRSDVERVDAERIHAAEQRGDVVGGDAAQRGLEGRGVWNEPRDHAERIVLVAVFDQKAAGRPVEERPKADATPPEATCEHPSNGGERQLGVVVPGNKDHAVAACGEPLDRGDKDRMVVEDGAHQIRGAVSLSRSARDERLPTEMSDVGGVEVEDIAIENDLEIGAACPSRRSVEQRRQVVIGQKGAPAIRQPRVVIGRNAAQMHVRDHERTALESHVPNVPRVIAGAVTSLYLGRGGTMPRRRQTASAGSAPWGWIGLGAAAIGAGYLLMTRQSAAAVPPLPPPGGGTGPSTPPANAPTGVGSAPVPSMGPNGPNPPSALVNRLRTSETARRVFALQALAYSYAVTDAVPDGIEGPVTDGIIRSLGQSAPMTNSTLGGVDTSLRTRFGDIDAYRSLPFTLPQDVIDAVNRSAASIDPSYPTLQVFPTVEWQTLAVNPSGQVMIPYPGYSRAYMDDAPSNSVSASPGYGVGIDPYGMNLGLWSTFGPSGAMGSGTGRVYQDVGAGPIAGSSGNAWCGYRLR